LTLASQPELEFKAFGMHKLHENPLKLMRMRAKSDISLPLISDVLFQNDHFPRRPELTPLQKVEIDT
jgi:hypothetical protein